MMVPLLATIVALGDSVTLGARKSPPVAPGQTFAALLSTRLGTKVVNAGIGGDNTDGMLARFDRDVLVHTPSAVLIMAGLNDAAYVDGGPKERTEPRVPAERYERNLTEMVRKAKEAKAQVVILTPNPMTRQYRYHEAAAFYQINDINDGLLPFTEAARRVARVNGACLVDVFGDWVIDKNHRRLLPDGLHPTAEGHRRIANLLLERCGAVLKPGARLAPIAAVPTPRAAARTRARRTRTTGTAAGSSPSPKSKPSATSPSRRDR